MPPVVVDSNVLLASRDLDSAERRERAAEIVGGIDHGELPTAHVTDYVLAEVLNLMHSRGYHRDGSAFYDRLTESAGYEIHRTTRSDFTDGTELYRERVNLSFVDCVLGAYMRRRELEYIYTFDGEFEGLEGVTSLDTAHDPFA